LHSGKEAANIAGQVTGFDATLWQATRLVLQVADLERDFQV
jgi:hypothetical protein